MNITPELIVYLEKLANLSLSDEEKTEIQSDLQDILAHIDVLSELDTENVPPLVHPFPATNVFRADSKHPHSQPREEILENAPDEHSGYFRVPKTIE